MRGPKLNEGATAIGERHGTKASARYVRSSASKARLVLDLIRGLDARRADEVLQFTDKAIAKDIRKVLASAVANASNPDNTGSYIADADELFVLACFADEGPTLKRFKARARGRGTRIRKRTCHITVVVARMSDQRLAVVQARTEGASASASASRRARVERSRKRAQDAKAAAATGTTADAAEIDDVEIEDVEIEDVEIEDVEVEDDEAAVQAFADVADADTTDEGSASRSSSSAESERRDEERSDDEGQYAASEWEGGVQPDADGNGPDTHLIKGNAQSMLYHSPESRYYKATKAEVWFDTEEHAEAAGFSKPGSQADASDETENN